MLTSPDAHGLQRARARKLVTPAGVAGKVREVLDRARLATGE